MRACRVSVREEEDRTTTDAPTTFWGKHGSPPSAPPWTVELHAGDVLYVPPYTWHAVETLTPSLSLSVRETMHD